MLGYNILQNIIAATGSVIIFLGLRTYLEPMANQYPVIFIIFGFALFLFAEPISKKITGDGKP